MKRLLASLCTIGLLAVGLCTVDLPAAAAAAGEWAPCSTTVPLPAYGVIVKGVYGTCVHSQAQVFQFDSLTGNKAMLVEVTNEGFGIWDNLVYVRLANAAMGAPIIENDIVYMVGRLDGTYTYTTSFLGTNTVPVIDVTAIHKTTPGSSSTPKSTPSSTVPKAKTPPKPVVGVVIAQAHASGEDADATADGTANYFPIEAVITSTPPQQAELTWDLTCDEGNGGTGSVEGQKQIPTPVVYHLTAPSASSDCDALVDVILLGSGTVTVKVED